MDSTRFDALTRSLATAANRRAFLRTAFAALSAGVGGALGHVSVLADDDDCKRAGKRCKKHKQCCSGKCIPDPAAGAKSTKKDGTCCTPDSKRTTCRGLCGTQINNCGQRVKCGKCCDPDADEVTCAGLCGPQTNNCDVVVECGECCVPESRRATCGTDCNVSKVNNCGDTIECGHCHGGQCAQNGECASDNCCEDTCIDCASVSETATTCGGCDSCCECFQGDSFGPAYCCTDPTRICGTYPNDVCCANQTECVNGACVKPVYICPHQIGGEPVDCRDQNGAGCCGGLCCPADQPVCLNGACHAELPACGYPDNLDCPAGSSCTANQWFTEGVCCTNMGSWSPFNDDNGDPAILNVCCGLNEKWGNDDGFGFCPECVSRDRCGCGDCTSRTSTPRIGR